MGQKTQTATAERRSESRQLMRELVNRRTEVLAIYSQLVGMRPFAPDNDGMFDLLQEFCEVLVDYTAAAHFGLYRHLDEGSERRQAVLRLADDIYPRISATTQDIVDFNDCYEEPEAVSDAHKLEHDLSELGERLAERIELEDRLIEALNRPRVVSPA